MSSASLLSLESLVITGPGEFTYLLPGPHKPVLASLGHVVLSHHLG